MKLLLSAGDQILEPHRSVHLLGTTTNPDGRWTTQQTAT
jgi:hypothetical protein